MKRARKYGFCIYVVPLFLVWAFTAGAQAKNTLNCTVVDENGSPVAKQEILLTSAGGKQTAKKTNDQGEVKFTGLDDGTYVLNGKDFASDKVEVSGNTEQPCKYTLVNAATANAKLQEALQLVQQKKYTEAEEKSKKLVQLMPGQEGSHYLLALAYANQGKNEAEAEIKKAAALNPEKYGKVVNPIQIQTLAVQAGQAETKKDVPGMMQKYDQMLAVADDKGTVYFNLAAACGRIGKFEDGLKAIDKAIALKPDDAEARQLKIRLQDLYLKQMDQDLQKK